MRVYHERLRVPPIWWVLGLATIVMLGAELAAGFGWLVAALIYAVLIGVYAALLLSWGRARIDVADGEFRAGTARTPLSAIAEVAALDQAQTRALRGANADPRAYLLARPYLRTAVYVGMRDQAGGVPYWLIGTRDPAGLAAALDGATAAFRADGSTVG